MAQPEPLQQPDIVVTTDVLIIVNQQNKPVRVLHDVKCNLTAKSMEFSSHHAYESQDMQKLQALGAKTGAFLISKEWKIAIPNLDEVKQTICYGFKSDDCRDMFFHQSYDFAIIFNLKNQMKVLLSDITYNYLAHSIHFKSATLYKSGYYEALGKYAQKIKLLTASEYRLVDRDANIDEKYVFDEVEEKDGSVFEPQRCLLWTLDTKNFDGWLEFVHSQSAEFDAGVLQNAQHENLYFFNKICVNWLENIVQAAMMEPFSDGKHNALIDKFGVRWGRPVKLKNFKLPNLKDNGSERAKCKYLCIYSWDMNKQQYAQPEDEVDDDEKQQMPKRVKLKMSKSVDFDQAKKEDEQKKDEVDDDEKQQMPKRVKLKMSKSVDFDQAKKEDEQKKKAQKGSKSKTSGKASKSKPKLSKTQTDKPETNGKSKHKKKKENALGAGKPRHAKTKSAMFAPSKKTANERTPKSKNAGTGNGKSKSKKKNNLLSVDVDAPVPKRPGHKKASKSISPTSPNKLKANGKQKKSLKLKDKEKANGHAGGLKVSTPVRHKKSKTAVNLPSKRELNGKKSKSAGGEKEKKKKKNGRDSERTIQPSVARRLSKENKHKLALPNGDEKKQKSKQAAK
eukprot:CAMPEP_0197072880 /NCGR_PEP_ID=MMETSP1384-20130603/210318_1 /TAXON_ID=29189 /ORGANISM="Ammonia sp." /LENGTH=619 /DNA_ID=CAMNT_0042511701 /DNA_START=17 /DNA_END=1876 /DNA_ORIENTATION=-